MILALAAAWFWLGRESDVPGARERAPDVPRINVVPDAAAPAARPQPQPQAQPNNEGAAAPAEPREGTEEVRPTVILESASRITADADTAQFQQLRQFDALERQLEPLFMEVEAHLANDRLIAPKGGNALETFQEILEIEPGNTRALRGISAIETQLVEAADAALAEGDLDTAEREISALAEFRPDNENVERVRGQIADIRLQRELEAEAARQQAEEEERQRQLEEQRQAQLQSLLAQAISRFDSGRLVEPPLDNALFFYREMLKIDPRQPVGQRGHRPDRRPFRTRGAPAPCLDRTRRRRPQPDHRGSHRPGARGNPDHSRADRHAAPARRAGAARSRRGGAQPPRRPSRRP
ncbi:MAG: hypothetical protein M5U09_12710 [Gammaproteobacteria bacterium]|nr:hypothetical protein [Gammaproteobacteria bacterium]